MTAGRRAFPYSIEAEEQAAPLPGRRKLRWRDRPRHFETLDAAVTFAALRAATTKRRQHVRRETGLRGLAIYAVRQRDVAIIPLTPPRSIRSTAWRVKHE